LKEKAVIVLSIQFSIYNVEQANTNPFFSNDDRYGVGIRTLSSTSNNSLHSTNKTHTKQAQRLAKSDTHKNRKNSNLNKTSTSSEQDHNKLLREKCAICVHQNFAANGNLPPELIELICLWPKYFLK